ncbi:TetR/AcrR family transcriptional regulator [Endozoicomonas sp.]|uniref:TetR/AcrR family transcriptional regulator n=1 Tax=Endozoicomonas sp. TaxID=1892382 RepID=UPI003AF75D7E
MESVNAVRKTMKRAALSQQQIVDMALILASEDSVHNVSFRKLADRLSVTPMAIYRYFDDKEALQAAMLDQFIINARVLPDSLLNWEQWLLHTSDKMYAALCSEPGWITLFGQIQLKPGALAVMDECLMTLEKAGFSIETAIESFFILFQNLLGAVCLNTAFNNSNGQGIVIEMESIQPYTLVKDNLIRLNKVDHQETLRSSITLLVESLKKKSH